MMFEAKDFDGVALPIAGTVIEADAVRGATSLYGIQYVMVVSEDGALERGTATTPTIVGDGAGALNVIVDSATLGTVTVSDGAGALNVIVDSGTLTAVTTITNSVTVTDGAGALNVICDSGCAGGTQYAVDTALGATPTGTLAIAIRDDALSALTPVEGDAIGLRVDANGALWVIPSGTTIVGDGAGALNVIVDSGTVTTVSTVTTLSQLGGVALPIEDAPETAAGVGIYAMSVRRDVAAASAGTTGDNATVNTDALGLAWTRSLDPCSGKAKSYYVVNLAAASVVQVAAAVASEFYYVCEVNLVTAAANNVLIASDDTVACASLTAGLNGGTTAATGWNFAANGGIALGNGDSTVMKTATANHYLCILPSAATQLSGTIAYVSAP